MAINTEFYSDSKAAKAHVGFQLLIILSLLSKDAVTTSQSIATIFIAIALPLLLVALTLLPELDTDMEKYSKVQYWWGAGTLVSGHVFGLLATASLLWGFNVIAGIVFIAISLVLIVVFSVFLLKTVGMSGLDFYEKFLSKETIKSAKELLGTEKNT
ncbi:Uncharacterised protein [Vibrio mimicus]|uniref:hypothetical protein n=1 Tax=Vibrio mimicus TaxID=674 RepID=UPI0002BB9788|nr:hypothetical protein [Vibrio mimicus]EMB48613.1 hypothetical protein D908_18201 [Vibrio mimicus CAIM 602]MBY7676748.1 hypothetical protein [Vibrio mimicus]MBY7728561.1 hypothetical protein [Vibrio mimicus]TXY30222.1 hypothetical protein FXE86_12135 [Vibrio mimicus]SUQ23586.1 Uncharacterised protein [Vibrio mimicus]